LGFLLKKSDDRIKLNYSDSLKISFGDVRQQIFVI
jgi:hypothetical protein